MKKILSLMLVLVMTAAVIAVPAIAAVPTVDGYASLPYKTETFAGFRNNSTALAANLNLHVRHAVGVNADRFPLYGDSALVGIHNVADGASFYSTADVQGDADAKAATDVAIVADELSTSTGAAANASYAEKALKVSATTSADVRGVSFGFVPNEILSQVEGIYFNWEERAITSAESAEVVLQWVDASGLPVDANVAEVAHTATLTDASYTEVNVLVKNNAISYNGGAEEAIDLDLAASPEGAVGLKLLVQYTAGDAGFETYLKNLEVGTVSSNMAALRGDARHYDNEATEIIVDFASPVVDGDEVKLYLDNAEVAGATYVWNTEATELTITAPAALGTSAGYRVSTSKAITAEGAIINDVRFNTVIRAFTTAVVTPNVVDVYDVNGNRLSTTVNIEGTDVDIKIYVAEGESIPTSIVPSFKYVGEETGFHPDFFYGFADEYDTFACELRGAYYVINGATAIPVKDFTLFHGGNATRNELLNVTISAEEIPGSVTAELSVDEGADVTALGLLEPVTITFSHGIADTEALAVTENGVAYEGCLVEWSIDKTTVTLSPNPMWTLGAEYVITIPEDASIFGEQSAIVADDLSFTATSDVPEAANLATFELTDEDLIYTFDATNKTVAIVAKTEETIDLTAVEFKATVDAVGAFVKIGDTALTETAGVFTGTIDISAAEGVDNAVAITVDNGFGEETDYSVYYISATNPPVETMEYGTVETFDDATVGNRFTGTNIIANSGFVAGNPGANATGNDATTSSTVQEESGNKFIRIEATGKGAGQWSNILTVAIPKSFFENAKQLVFAYDVKQSAEFNNGRLGVSGSTATGGASFAGHGDLNGISLFGHNSKWRTWFRAGSFTADRTITDCMSGTITYGSWENFEIVIENAVVPVAAYRDDAYEGKTGTRIGVRHKLTTADEWSTIVYSEPAAWNFKDEEYVRFYIAGDSTSGSKVGNFDNFKIYAVAQDLATEVILEGGEAISVGESVQVKFKTPIAPGSETNFTFTDSEGGEVGYDYSWSDDRLTLTLTPDVEANKVYTLESVNLLDVYDNNIIVNAEVPVYPDVEFEVYDEDAEYVIIPDDYSQTLNIIYKNTAAGTAKMDVDFIYGSETASENDVTAPKANAGEAFATLSIVVPSAVVESGEEAVKIAIEADAGIEILGVYFKDGIVLEDINSITEDDAANDIVKVLEEIAASLGISDDFDDLTEKGEDTFVDELLEKLEEGEFEDLDEAKEWYKETLEKILEDEPKPTSPGKDDDDGSSSGGSSSSTTYPGGSSYIPTPSEAALTTRQFTDLASASWAKTAINTLYEAGVVNGVTSTTYAPLNDVKREEFVKLLVVTFGIYDPFLSSSFADVSSDAWYDSYIASAEQAGIVAGVSETEFGVGQNITREQMATMLKRACDRFGITLPETSTATFSDADSISDYAVDSVKALAKAGVINGIDGAFVPKQSANRAMAAQVVYLVYIKL